MANLSLPDPNFVYVDNYFYTINDSLQLLIKTTFDGEIAFCYALDMPVGSQVTSLDYDGIYFWSLETGTSRVIIRKWKIIDLLCVQQDKFEIISSGQRTIEGYAFAVEHYTTTFVNKLSNTVIEVEDASEMEMDLHLVIGPNTLGESEEVIVDSISGNNVTLTSSLFYTYSNGDLIRFYKSGYYFNNYATSDPDQGALLEIDLETGSESSETAGTQFRNVRSAVFGQVKNKDGDPVYDFNDDDSLTADDVVSCVMFISGTTMLFCESVTHAVYGSMVMDLPGIPPATVYDLTLGRDTSSPPDPNINGSTIYMLKTGYNYQVAQFDRMVNSISVTAAPAILPADNSSISQIRASVLDQYGKPYESLTVYFEISPVIGTLGADQALTDQYGVAEVSYTAGSTVSDVTIKATVSQPS